MLTEADMLPTISEIAVAFAGFAALAGVIGRRRNQEGARLDLERLRAVIYISLFVVVAALIPIVVGKYQLAAHTTWRASSCISLLLNWAFLAVILRHATRGKVAVADDPLAVWVGWSLEAAVELPLIANVLGLFSSYAPAFYFTFLFAALCQAAFSFLRLIDSLFAHEIDR